MQQLGPKLETCNLRLLEHTKSQYNNKKQEMRKCGRYYFEVIAKKKKHYSYVLSVLVSRGSSIGPMLRREHPLTPEKKYIRNQDKV